MSVNPYLTPAEAAEYTRFKKQTIYDMVKLKCIPYVKARKKLLFKISELDLWLNNGATAEVAQSIMKLRSQISFLLLETAKQSIHIEIGNNCDIPPIIERALKIALEMKEQKYEF